MRNYSTTGSIWGTTKDRSRYKSNRQHQKQLDYRAAAATQFSTRMQGNRWSTSILPKKKQQATIVVVQSLDKRRGPISSSTLPKYRQKQPATLKPIPLLVEVVGTVTSCYKFRHNNGYITAPTRCQYTTRIDWEPVYSKNLQSKRADNNSNWSNTYTNRRK